MAKLLKLFQNVIVQDKSAPRRAEHVPLGQGRRPAHLRERGDCSPSTPARRSTYVIPKHDDPDREPDRRRSRTARTSSKAQQFIRFLKTPAAQQDLRRPTASGRSSRASRGETRRSSRPPGPVHDQPARPRRLGQGADGVLRSRHGRHGRDRAAGGRLDWLTPHSRRARWRATRGTAAGTASSLGMITTFLTVHRDPAAGGARLGVAKGGAHGFWNAVTNPEAVAALKLTLGSSLVVSVLNAVSGRSSPGCSSATTSAARRRQRAHRPALRAADDRRRADPARALRAALPARRSTSRTRARRSCSP